MATKYALQQVGVADGTVSPPDKASARQVNADVGCLIASKQAEAWANGDVVYLGRKPRGNKITDIKVCTDTSFSTSTLSVGVGGDPRAGGTVTTAAKYVNGATNTATNKMVSIGPLASTLDDAPLDEDEHLWLTIGTADIASGVVASLVIEFARLH